MKKTAHWIFSFVAFIVLSCVQVADSDSMPSGWITLTGSAIRNQDTLLGAESRADQQAVLALSAAAALYHAKKGHGYEWTIHQLGRNEELSSLDAGAHRFQLLASEGPPMSRRLRVGGSVASGEYQAELRIYSNNYKVKDASYLVTYYVKTFQLANT